MKKLFILLLFIIPLSIIAKNDYKVNFIEYDLDNGLHVILYQNKNSADVVVGIKYHVGSKNEEADRTGFAHFFEHLQFHGTENIAQGEFENIVMTAGGYSNAYTSYDVTYYYEFFPAHDYKKGIWLESERMLHPKITQEGIDRERNIVKEEKRMRYDNKPMGNAYNEMMVAMYDPKTYGHSMIGSMEHLDAASLGDFKHFFNTYYVPNNACLVLAGNINIEDSKKWIKEYFSDIPRGEKIKRPSKFGPVPRKEKIVEKIKKGINKTGIMMAYNCMPETDKDSFVLNVITAILSGDKSYSYFKKNILKKDSTINFLEARTDLWENVGYLHINGNVKKNGSEKNLRQKIKNEIERLKNEKLSTHQLKKILNAFEIAYMDSFFHNKSLADMLSNYYLIWGNTKKFNNLIENYTSITPEDIQRVAKQYLIQQNCTTIIYHPEK